MKEQFKLEFKLNRKILLENSVEASVCKFADWFFIVFWLLQMQCAVFCNLAFIPNIKTNQPEIMILTIQADSKVPCKINNFT